MISLAEGGIIISVADCSQILPLVLDHAKDEDNSKTITETIGKFGQLDVLINNAGW